MQLASTQVTIQNQQGLHGRPATVFAETANAFTSDIRVRLGDQEVDGKSVMHLMMLAATKGAQLDLTAQGPDADQAIDALRRLIARDFDEP